MYEISSDSEDDRYDGFAQKLQKLKSKQALSNTAKVANGFLDLEPEDSYSVTSLNRKDDVIPVVNSDFGSTLTPIELDTTDVELTTRSRGRKRKEIDVDFSPITPTRKGGKRSRGRDRGSKSVSGAAKSRGRGKRGTPAQNVMELNMAVDIVTPPPRRGRSRRCKQRTPQSIPTYSIGNTCDYPDASDNQVLFSNNLVPVSEQSTTIDLDDSLNNEELSVKVFWQHSEVFKFNIRRLQKLSQIFDFFVNKEGVSRNRLLFTYNYKKTNKILRPDDTPDSIDYNIAKFIEGGIVNKQLTINSSNTPQKNGFFIKFQCQNMKRPLELIVAQDEKIQLAMVKCAEHLEIPIAKLIFEFDGETILGNRTPSDLEMESGDCVDVKILN